MRPIDLITEIADNVLICPTANRQGTPGDFISRLPTEKRELLKNLKSDDFKTIRPDVIPSYIMSHNESYARRLGGRIYDYLGRVVVRLENNGILR